MSESFASLSGLELRDAGMLWLALLIPLALFLRARRGLLGVDLALARLWSEDGGAGLPSSWRTRLAAVPCALQVLGLCLIVLALARPVLRVPLPPESEGVDMVMCLDTSSSMSATDMGATRTRLDVARDAATRFVRMRTDDRIGLVSFARFPDLRCPLTTDHAALERLMGAVLPVRADGPEDATGIGTAVARAAALLRTSEAPSKVVVLLTDGEENVATAGTPAEIAPLHAAQLCERLGVRVYAIAAGVGHSLVGGRRVALDTSQIQVLAERTGGVFFTARDAGAVDAVYAAINQLETAPLGRPLFELRERFGAFLFTALALLLAGRALEASVLGVFP